mgnify:CR=1 FL=1
MKRIIKSLAIAAFAALAFSSCSQEQNPVSHDKGFHFTIRTSENPQVKSFIENGLDGTYTPKWSKGDELAMFVGTISDKSKPTATLTNSNETGLTAKFDGQVTGIEGDGTFKSFAPAKAFATGYSNGNVGITLAETQKPSSLTIDEACDILVAKETSYMADATGEVTIDDLFFKRMFSVVKVMLNGPVSLKGQNVSKFSLTAPEGTVLTGRAAIDLTTATIDKWNIDNNSVTATYEADAPVFGGASGRENAVWLVVNPCTVASGAKVVFTGETANYTFSKEVTLSKALTFPASQLAVINLTLAEENCTKKVAGNAYVLHEDELIEGDYLVVYEGKAMKASVASKRLAYSDVTVNNNTIANSDESIVWHISQSGNYWTIENNNKYAASTGTKNQAQLLDKGSDDKSLWTVTKTAKASTFEFVNKANSTTKVNANLRNNGNYGFACYATSTGGPLSLYRLSGPIDNTLPTLSVNQTSKVWAADATDAFVVKVTVNSEGGDWKVTPETLSWATIAVDKAAGTISITPNGANETETANEATLTVTHASDASLTKEISLKQNGVGGAALTEKTATIQFGADNVKIDQASVTANDNQKNSWTITTVGTTSFNPNPDYYQVGSSKKPATSITFTTTLPEDAEVTSISAKFGGFNETQGTITLKVGDVSVGTGKLEGTKNGTDDVIVTNTSTAAGNKVTITVTNIAKGVKCYNIQVKYKTAN